MLAVVGGGIAGLAAAWEATGPQAAAQRVVLLEAGPRLGGKIRTEELVGIDLDAGPDAFLARVPEAVSLCEELGLSDELVAPATGRAHLWVRGRLRRLPEGLVLGVPSRLWPLALSGILSPQGLARAATDLVLPTGAHRGTDRSGAPLPDRSVSEVVTARLGAEVDRRLVDPLLGGIHAGSTQHLSLAANAPQLDQVARRSRSLMSGLRGLQRPATSSAPLFLTPRRGLGRLVDSLAVQLKRRGVDIRTSSPVGGLTRSGGRWRLALPAGPLEADAVVVAVPAPDAATALSASAPAAARELAAIAHASVSLVALAYQSNAFEHRLDGSGFLVPAEDGRLLTACTWTSSKWPHLSPPGLVLLRASTGRAGDDRSAALDDGELARRVHLELQEAIGVSAPPVAHRVSRWPGSFPQYDVGHLQRVERIEAAVAAEPGLAVAGAALRGVGIPACIGSGRQAARRAAALAPPPASP